MIRPWGVQEFFTPISMLQWCSQEQSLKQQGQRTFAKRVLFKSPYTTWHRQHRRRSIQILRPSSCCETARFCRSHWSGSILELQERITMSKSFKIIDISAFANCSSWANIELPDMLRYIGAYAFAACKSLRGITLPQSVTTLKGTGLKG